MKSVFIIKNRDNSPFMVVSTTPEGTKFQPMTESAKEIAVFLREEYSKTKITRAELEQTMDSSKIIEGPSPDSSITSKKVALLKDEPQYSEQLATLPVLSISEVLLSEFSNAEYRNVLTFKASSFISDQTRSSANFEVKAVRAVWDPSLAIPGTNRRGGFRCPVGTRYGGQITDRFGRSCGWGVARRIANQIADIGERLEQRDDDKRKRRLDRRNARMIARLQGEGRAGRLEGGLRGIAERLDGGGSAPRAPRPQREIDPVREANRQEALAELRRLRDDVIMPRIPRRRGERAPRDEEVETPSTRPPRNRRRDVIPETAPTPKPRPRPVPQGGVRPTPGGLPSLPDYRPNDPVGNRSRYIAEAIRRLAKEKRDAKSNRPDGISNENWKKYKDYVDSLEHVFGYGGNDRFASVMSYDEWARRNNVTPRAPQAPSSAPAPARPRPARPQPRPQVTPQPENVDVLTAREASDAGESEAFKPYVLRKYNEYAQRVREIREGGGNAGMLTRREWYAINKDNLRDAWKDVHGRSAPQDFEPPAPRRPQNNRRRRRAATAVPAGRSASRKPTPDDVPEPAPARPVRPARKPFNAPGQRGQVSLIDALRKRNEMRRDGAQDDDLKIVLHNGKHYVVKKSEIDRANANGANIRALPEPPQPPPARPAVVQPPTPPSPVGPTNLLPAPSPQAPPTPSPTPRQESQGRKKSPFRKFARSRNAHGKLKINREESPIGKFVSEEDRTIDTQEKAIDYIKNGGDIQKVPAKFMHIAIEANSSRDVQDASKRFRQIPPNGGAVGVTKIYYLRDENGNISNQGWVFKAAKPADNVGELIGWNYLAAVGILEDGAIQDGKLEVDVQQRFGVIRKGNPYIMIPLAHNDVPDGAKIGDGIAGGDFNKEALEGLPNKGLPERLSNVLANYILGVADRHSGNGMGRVVETPDGQKLAHVVPMDLGWAGKAHGGFFSSYSASFSMDRNIIATMRTALPAMSDAQRRETYARIQEVYRQIIVQTEKTLAVGREQFVQDALQKISKTDTNKARAGRLYDGMVASLRNLRAVENEIVNILPSDQR